MGSSGVPAWVRNVREEIGRSPAWEVLSDQLYERVSTVLKSHGLGHFSDLPSAEQTTLLEEAHRAIMSEDNKVYQAFESQFSKSMDAEIAKEARSRMNQDENAAREGADEALYLERILDAAAEGAVSLLRELPREYLGSLRLMLNQPIPSRARLDIWRFLLKHTSVRQEYELLMKQNRNSTISGQDIYITHRCQALLESGRVATRRLLPLTSRNVVLMKTVLSYHHACKMSKPGQKATVDVPESFVHFIVPLCAVVTRGAFMSQSSGSLPAGGEAGSASAATTGPGPTAATAAAAAAVGGGAGGVSGVSNAISREQKIELMIEELVEMFESALEAGLQDLVDPSEISGTSGAGVTVAGSRDRKGPNYKFPRLPRGGRGAAVGAIPTATIIGDHTKVSSNTEEVGDKKLPMWVGKVHDALVPGFQGLVYHITRAHLGLAVAVAEEDIPTEGSMPDSIRSNNVSNKTSTTIALADIEGENISQSGLEGQSPRKEADQSKGEEPVDSEDLRTLRRRSSAAHRAAERRASQNVRERRSSSVTAVSDSAGSKDADGAVVDVVPTGHHDTKEDSHKSSTEDVPVDTSTDAPVPLAATSDNATKSVNATDSDEHVNTYSGGLRNSLPKVDVNQSRDALWALLKPLVAVGLVGHLGIDACLFAWDQAIIGGFGAMIPRVAAMLVAAARGTLEACTTFARISEALLAHTHLVSTAQLQDLLEVHCMPSIREELRVSEKLASDIVGPSLATATAILDNAYAIRAKAAQEKRGAHVEHALGPRRGSARSRRQGRLKIDWSLGAKDADEDREVFDADGKGARSDGHGNRPVDKRSPSVSTAGGGGGGYRQKARTRGRRNGNNGESSKDGVRRGGNGEGERKKTWRSLLSHRGNDASDVAGKDAAKVDGVTRKNSATLEDAEGQTIRNDRRATKQERKISASDRNAKRGQSEASFSSDGESDNVDAEEHDAKTGKLERIERSTKSRGSRSRPSQGVNGGGQDHRPEQRHKWRTRRSRTIRNEVSVTGEAVPMRTTGEKCGMNDESRLDRGGTAGRDGDRRRRSSQDTKVIAGTDKKTSATGDRKSGARAEQRLSADLRDSSAAENLSISSTTTSSQQDSILSGADDDEKSQHSSWSGEENHLPSSTERSKNAGRPIRIERTIASRTEHRRNRDASNSQDVRRKRSDGIRRAIASGSDDEDSAYSGKASESHATRSAPRGHRTRTRTDGSVRRNGGRPDLEDVEDVQVRELKLQIQEAQMAVYKRHYTEEEIAAMTGRAHDVYNKKKAKYEKALASIRQADKSGKAGKTAKANNEKEDGNNPSAEEDPKVAVHPQSVEASTTVEGEKMSSSGATRSKRKSREEKAKSKEAVERALTSTAAAARTPAGWRLGGDGSSTVDVVAPASPLKRWLGFGGGKTKAKNKD